MAYINKENLVKDVQRHLIPGTDEHGEVSEGQATRYFLSLIDKHTVTDVVEVVTYVKWFTSQDGYVELSDQINRWARKHDLEIVSISVIAGFCAMVVFKKKVGNV